MHSKANLQCQRSNMDSRRQLLQSSLSFTTISMYSAFYSKKVNCSAMTRYISSLDLPLSLQTNLKKSYSDYWISDLFEVSNNDGTAYYITAGRCRFKD